MGMTVGTSGDSMVVPQMNVTPLVDVVLVLLIICMIITPLLTKTFWIHTPMQQKEEVEAQALADDPTQPIVLRVGPARTLEINGTEVALEELPERLRRIFAARSDHILFFVTSSRGGCRCRSVDGGRRTNFFCAAMAASSD